MRGIPSVTAATLVGVTLLAQGCPNPPDLPRLDAGSQGRDGGGLPDECKASVNEPATLVVGQGQRAFEDLADNQEVAWEAGPQGGHHIWVSVRTRGIRQSGSIVTLSVSDSENPTQPVLLTERRVVFDLQPVDGGACALVGIRMQLDETVGVDLQALDGHHAAVAATVEDPDGARASATRLVVLRPPTPDAGVSDAGP